MGKIQKMVDYAIAVAKDNKRGYSQVRRWPSQGTDFDCSSLMYEAAHHAGYDVTVGPSGTHYTGTMLADFTKAGFTALPFDGCLTDLDPGDIMLNVQNHTEMYIGDGKFVGAHSAEGGGIDGKPGDQTGREISIVPVYNYPWDYVLVPPRETAKASAPAKVSSTMRGIDIASHQEALVPSRMTTTDFIIVKATGGRSYTNPCWQGHADAVLNSGKLLGLYHFACEYGKPETAEHEADYFVSTIRPYIGKATLWLDYEQAAVSNYPVEWCLTWLDRVARKTGATPGIYMSKDITRERDWSKVAAKYPLWVAQYADYTPRGWEKKPWTDAYGYGAWKAPSIFQYSSVGRIAGYSGKLDINLAYISKARWHELAGDADGTAVRKPKAAHKPDNSTLARAACSLAYSRPAQHDPKTDANARTSLYGRVYDELFKASDTQKAAPRCWNVQGRSCDRSVASIARWSGVDDSMPRTCEAIYEHMEKSARWQDLGRWDGKESSLKPGDVLIQLKRWSGVDVNHVCVYVGTDAAKAVYTSWLKGTDADKGSITTGATWVSGHRNGGNPPDKGYAPCIGNATYAMAGKRMHVFRCVKPQGSNKYTSIGF